MLDVKTFLNSCLKRFDYQFVRCRQDELADQLRLLRAGEQTIFDVGANQGHVTRSYRALFPTATIHCFEPGQEAFQILTKATTGDALIKHHQRALSDVTGRRDFYINRKNTNNSLLRVSTKCGDFIPGDRTESLGCVEVASTTLDDFCQANGIRHIDLLKMDIQGGELMALRGGAQMLDKAAIDVIYTEVLFAGLYEGQGGFHDLYALLASHGYVLYRLYNLVHNKSGILTYGDALFVSPQVERALAGKQCRHAA